jgi:bifunctional non-homologous end joining protein LigD
MDGALKSWAIPKGPTIDPAVKRLAMIVEDHPLAYQKFEGIIPEGSYGAGTVMIWDEGTYEPLNVKGSRKTQEKAMLEELKEGSIKVVLYGKKLKGEVALVRTNGRGENSWLYIKHRDEYAGTADITKKNKSVKSEKTLKQISTSSKNIYKEKIVKPGSTAKDNVEKSQREKVKSKKVDSKENSLNSIDVNAIVKQGKKAAFPKTISPMLATLVDEPFDEPGWIYEIKWDGYRAISLINKKEVRLISRNNKSFNEKFYPIYNAVQAWPIRAVVDGEIVVVNNQGISDFSSLQGWRSEADGDLVYYVFDLLWFDGYDLTNLPLLQRREILQHILPDDGSIRMSENFETSVAEFLEAAKQIGVEGIIAKKADSEYSAGERTKEWLKIKVNKRHEVVVGGFTNNEGSGKVFSSLLVGVYENGKLEYTGKIGTGFNEKQQREMMKLFKPLVISKCPFTFVPDVNKSSRFRPNPPKAAATWLQPKLVCEVSYAEITQDGVMRHPSFEGMREDKSAKSVTREKALPVEKVMEEENEKDFTEKKLFAPSKDKDRKTLLNPKDETQVRSMNGHELKFTNLHKVFWPKEKYTKRDMINYYYQVASYILPYLKDRPQSLNRFPHGIDGESFYQKDVTGKVPDWLKTFPYHTTEESVDKNYMICTDEAGVLFMANLGCIEMNPWNSTIKKPDHPTWCILDLDPDTKNTFDQVIQTAQVVKQVLDSIGVPSYCKTSGSTGMHIYIPLGAKYTYDECQLFGKLVATMVHYELPAFTSIERFTKNRKNKLYIDYLQNRPKATLAAPYSLRPKPGATVSMPLHWEEVKKGLKLQDFTIENAVARIKSEGDIFKPVIGKGIDLKKILGMMSDE